MITSKTERVVTVNPDGSHSETIKESTVKVERSTEPDYIKLYTKMWCEFNGIPYQWRDLFLQLAIRMTYASTLDSHGGQVVSVIGVIADDIMTALNIKSRSYLGRGLKALCGCRAIKRIGRGIYQINPQYAGRGSWKYNPRLQQGGIEDLVATFSFKDGSVNTEIVWADDGTDNEMNAMYREGLKVAANQGTVLKRIK